MSTYIHFTDEQKQRAASVDLEEFLRCRGEKLLTSGREKRLARDHSVTIRGQRVVRPRRGAGRSRCQLRAAVLSPQLSGGGDHASGG